MRAAVIVSTYNSPRALERVLWGYAGQTFQKFELIVADDGSDERPHAGADRGERRNTGHFVARLTVLAGAVAEYDVERAQPEAHSCTPFRALTGARTTGAAAKDGCAGNRGQGYRNGHRPWPRDYDRIVVPR